MPPSVIYGGEVHSSKPNTRTLLRSNISLRCMFELRRGLLRLHPRTKVRGIRRSRIISVRLMDAVLYPLIDKLPVKTPVGTDLKGRNSPLLRVTVYRRGVHPEIFRNLFDGHDLTFVYHCFPFLKKSNNQSISISEHQIESSDYQGIRKSNHQIVKLRAFI